MSFAAGGLPEALAAVVSSHAAVCPVCRAEIARMERLGSAMLAGLPSAILTTDHDSAFALADRDYRHSGESADADLHDRAGDVPLPLRRLVGSRLDDIAWRRLGFGIWHYPLELSPDAQGDLRLLKIAAGLAMPEHGHGGSELTLVLRGAYSDETGTYRSGDLADLDEGIEHRPITDVEQGCICLIASEKRARFKTLFGRVMQPLTGL